MDLSSIYISNGSGVAILLMLWFASRIRSLRHRTEDRLFLFVVLGVILACVAEVCSYAIEGHVFTGARVLNYALNTYLYTVNLLLPFCVLVYIDLGLHGELKQIGKKYRLQIAVGIVMFAVNVLNFFLPVTFWISEQNVYERRPFSYVYYLVLLFYGLTGYVRTRQYEKENGEKTFFRIELFLLPVVVGAGLQYLFYGLSLGWLAAAVGLIGMFMMQQNEMAFLDPLTDTYNRQYLNHVLTAWIGKGREFSGAMLDLDDFKRINDEFGHSEGDAALKAVADILKRAQEDGERVYRFAGDEFVILRMTDEPDGLTAYMERALQLLAAYNEGDRPYQIKLSYGMSHFKNDSVDAFMREMDERMYEMKARHHAAG